MTSTTSGTYQGGSAKTGAGWITYASIMLGVAGIFNIVDAIVALSKSSFYVDNAKYVFSDLRTWAWIILALGIVQVVAAVGITRGSEVSRWFGVAAASLNAIGQLLFLPSYPLWAISVFAIDILVIYALIVYGGAKVKAWA
jgi:hypothetical protein